MNSPSPIMSLNEYIRTVANLKGTKKSCQEGGCGACVVSLTQFDNVQQKNVTVSVNSVCGAVLGRPALTGAGTVSATAVQRGRGGGDDD